MKKIISWILAVAIIASFSCTAALAAGTEVTTGEELVAAVKRGASIITVKEDVTLTETLKPKFSLTLIGEDGVTVSGDCGTFIYSSENVTVDNITFSGATDSAIVMDGGALSISNSVFTGNSAAAGGAVRYNSDKALLVENTLFENNIAAGDGGAIIFEKSGSANFVNTHFKGNKAGEWGGAVYASTTWTILNMRGTGFENNTAAAGGAVCNMMGSLETNDSIFTDNKATNGHGGAIYGWHLYTSFIDTDFNKNYASGNGGAVWVETDEGWPSNQYAYIYAYGCDITNNTAGNQGGAFGGQNLPYSIFIDNCNVSGNKAYMGGALYTWCSVDVRNSVVKNNKCDTNGGAIWSNWTIYCEDSEFAGNYTKWFGGVAFSNVGDITFYECTMKNNEADPYYWGGAAVAYTETMNIYLASCDASGNRGFKSSVYMAKNGTIHQYEATDETKKNVVDITVEAKDGYEIENVKVPGSAPNGNKFTIVTPEGVDTSAGVVAEMNKTRECEVEQYVDIADNMHIHKAVDYVVEKKLMNGTSDTTFEPDTLTNRAMIVTVLHRLAGYPEVTFEKKFSDVKKDMWYTDAIIWAANNGVVAGYDNGKYGPEDLITREQLAAILYRYATLMGYDVSANKELDEGFTNIDKCGDYSADAVKWANAVGILKGNVNEPVDVVGNVSRGEIAEVLMAFGTYYAL